jgi:hypothetical protein
LTGVIGNVFANTLTLTGTAGQTTLYVTNNVFVSDTVTKMIDNTSLAMYVGGGTITSVPTRAINTYSTSYPNFLATGSSHFYFNDSVKGAALPSSAGAGASFGSSVAFSADGNTALVGAPDALGGGYAAVYRFTNGSWSATGTPLAVTSGNFGSSVALSTDGNTALVGAHTASSSTGYAAVYRFTNGSWSATGTSLPSSAGAGAYFGSSVAFSADGNTALVGALAAASYAGYAAVYRFTNGSWSAAAPLAVTSGTFGNSVALSSDGNTALVGAKSASGGGYAAVYRFTNGVWSAAEPLAVTGTLFGNSVALSADGNTALVGAPFDPSGGAAAVFLTGPKFKVNNTLVVYNNAVGIAISTPTANLHVVGNIYASNAVTTTNIFATNVYASGYVGIRTTSPIEVLDVRGGSISLGTYNSTSSGRYVGYYNGTGGNDCLVGMEIENTTLGGNYSQKLHLRTHWFGNNNGRRLTIDENGNVFVAKNLTTSNPYWFITYSSGGNATYTPTSGSWFSSTANGTIYGNSISVGGTALTSAFNTTSGTFTFPVAGTYLISVPMFINGAAAGRYAIATFGSSIKPISQYFEFTSTNLPTNEMRTWTFVKQVNGNDTMYLSTPAGSITLYLAETHTTLNIFKVG